MTPSIYSLFVIGAILACFLTPIIRHFALKKGFVDCPHRARKVHQQATPRLGGAAILLSLFNYRLYSRFNCFPTVTCFLVKNPVIGAIVLGSIGIFIIGFLDDLARLSPKTKLVGEFFIAGLVVFGANLSFTSVQFFSHGTINFPEWFGFCLACLWIVGMTNAINLIDGLDGLASGITLVGLLAVSIVGYLAGISSVTWMSTLLIGCLLGFLVYNSRPASIFLGDCGSLTLGYLAGCLALLSSFRDNSVIDGIFPVLAFSVPIIDCVFAICRRTMRGRSPFSPDMEHFHHRLMTRGLSHGKAVLAMWAMAFCCSLVAVAAAFGKGDQLFAVFVFFGLGGFILLRYLGYFRFEFFGEGLSSLMEDRKSTKSVEQAIKEAEQIVSQSESLEQLEECLSKVGEGMEFQRANISFYMVEGRLGSELKFDNPKVEKLFPGETRNILDILIVKKNLLSSSQFREEILHTEKAEYVFWDGRSSLSVQDEVLLERVHDSISNLAGKLRKEMNTI